MATVRVVSDKHLRVEFEAIGSLLRKNKHSFVSLDTEFPGTIFKSQKPFYDLSQQENYSLLRENVNNLKLIQLGFTICDQSGKSPCVWEFNFRDFDVEKDLHNPDSINLLKKQGIDFLTNRSEGIRAADFAEEFLSSELGFSLRSFLGRRSIGEVDPSLTWVFFHCTYDLGYLIKVLTRKPLPENPVDFMRVVRMYLGSNVFDLKEIVKVEPFGWHCGLSQVAENLNVPRIAGESHQAGSDSLLTLQCFLAVLTFVMCQSGEDGAAATWRKFNYKLHGLGVDESIMMGQQSLMQRIRKIDPYPYHHDHPYGGRVVVGVRLPPMKRYAIVNAVPLVPVPVPVPIFGL